MAQENGSEQATPSTQEGDGLEGKETEKASRARASDTESEEFYEAPQEPGEVADASEKAPRKEHQHSQIPFGQPLRTQTTPAKVQRRGTLRLWSRERTNTGAGARANDNPRDPFQYTFDPLSSGSESASSSEDEGAVPGNRPQEEAQERRQRQKSSSSTVKDKSVSEEERQGRSYSQFAVGNDYFKTKGRVSKRDGRLKISISETANSGYVAKALGQSIRNHLNVPKRDKKGSRRRRSTMQPAPGDDKDDDVDPIASYEPTDVPRPRLNIVIMVIGSRGDIQPFLQVGKILQHQYGHRVRIASHPTFRDFVEQDAGLDFFSVGGDPSELMAFMVKNPGLIPNLSTVREGEIQRRRASMAAMFEGFWRACIQSTDDEKDEVNLQLRGEKSPFIVDAIIANPPSMAHVHIAEKMGVPLHVMFTFPYTPTTAFPHPLANIKARRNNVDTEYVNFMSYPLVEMMTWQGLGDIVNKFRVDTLGLEPVSSLWAPGALYRMKVPYTYMWSPSLVPKPEDWGPEIDLAGFVFLDLASDFKPPQDLVDFLDAGEPPVYVGFGSIVIDEPDKFTQLIFQAAELAGVRVLVNKGWGGLGQDNSNTPKNVFMLENTPHDWLFPRVKAVVHHGGAGTTAIGLKLGKPTMIIPFFGDQPFWGARVAEAKAGAHQYLSYKKLTAERLAEGIKQCLTDEARENAQKIADAIAKEGDGALNAVKSFHRRLPLAGKSSMRCSILQDHVAVWRVKRSSLRLSSLAAEILQKQGKIQWSQLKLLRHYEWNDFDGPGGPFTGGAGALSSSLYEVGAGFGMVPVRVAKHMREREEMERKRREHRERREERQRRKAEQAAHDDNDATRDAAHSTENNGVAKRPSTTRQETTTTTASTLSTADDRPPNLLSDVGTGIKRSTGALLTLPNDFTLAVAQGFHNAPRLYGDATVRKPVRITDWKSGCLAARREFTHGVSDAWTGLVTQPKYDWQEGEGIGGKFMGLGTGVGKGVGGFVLKNVSAVLSPGAFVTQGVVKSLEAWSQGPGGTEELIRKAHRVQGQNGVKALLQLSESEDQERGPVERTEERVLRGWAVYEDLWTTARKMYAKPAVVGRVRFRRERKKWFESGALENVDTAERALRAVKAGEDVEGLLERHQGRVRENRRPKGGAMDGTEEGKTAVGGGERDSGRKGGRSEDTAIGTPDDIDGKKIDVDRAAQAGDASVRARMASV